jgi:NADH:ubiquinone oxidoreductase subunit E
MWKAWRHSIAQIFRQPVGRHVIRYCDSVVCHITGYQGIQAALEQNLNIKPGPDHSGRTLYPAADLLSGPTAIKGQR